MRYTCKLSGEWSALLWVTIYTCIPIQTTVVYRWKVYYREIETPCCNYVKCMHKCLFIITICFCFCNIQIQQTGGIFFTMMVLKYKNFSSSIPCTFQWKLQIVTIHCSWNIFWGVGVGGWTCGSLKRPILPWGYYKFHTFTVC